MSNEAVLVITGSLEEGDAIRSALSGRGLESVVCGNPLEALSRIEKKSLELVVCALELPGMDGLELLAKIHYVSPGTPVLLTTRERALPIDLDAALAGACTVLRKPYTVPELLAAVADAMSTRGLSHPPAETLHDSTLTSALSGIIRRLRGRRYEDLQNVLKNVLHGHAVHFAGDLAEHLRYEEEVLFPSLAELKASARPELELLEKEHDRLRDYSKKLAQRLTQGDGAGAADLARTFLAVLLEHMERESAAVDAIVAPLGFAASLDLGRRLLQRRLRVSLRGGPRNA
jgi:CheY-like chemotaxis protein